MSNYCKNCYELQEQLDKLAEENEKLQKEKQDYCFDCDVAERMRKVTYAATGGRLSYANYTVEAIEQAYNDQLRIDVEYRTKELEEQLEAYKMEAEEGKKINAELKAENDKLKEEVKKQKDIAKEYEQRWLNSYGV